jgi:hypothetical protein
VPSQAAAAPPLSPAPLAPPAPTGRRATAVPPDSTAAAGAGGGGGAAGPPFEARSGAAACLRVCVRVRARPCAADARAQVKVMVIDGTVKNNYTISVDDLKVR